MISCYCCLRIHQYVLLLLQDLRTGVTGTLVLGNLNKGFIVLGLINRILPVGDCLRRINAVSECMDTFYCCMEISNITLGFISLLLLYNVYEI